LVVLHERSLAAGQVDEASVVSLVFGVVEDLLHFGEQVAGDVEAIRCGEDADDVGLLGCLGQFLQD
jgi:hypothetical protein